MAQCFSHATIINGKDSANRIAERQACLNVLLRCSLSYAKIAQTSAMKVYFLIAECSLSSAKIAK